MAHYDKHDLQFILRGSYLTSQNFCIASIGNQRGTRFEKLDLFDPDLLQINKTAFMLI